MTSPARGAYRGKQTCVFGRQTRDCPHLPQKGNLDHFLSEKKFYKPALECLLNTCFQYHPKYVLSFIETLLFLPQFNKKDRIWAPVIMAIAEIIRQFGVQNIYVIRVLHTTHLILQQSKMQEGRDACYHLICVCYKQLCGVLGALDV